MKLTNDPGLPDVARALKRDVFRSLNCVRVGRISSFDGTKKTAAIAIMGKRVLASGGFSDYPPLIDVPVVTLQGGGAVLQLPVASGDFCVVLFSDRDIDAWFTSGSATPPATDRAHDFSDGLAIVGLNPLSNPGAVTPADEAGLVYGGAKVTLTTGLVKIANATTTLLTVLTGLITVLETLQTQDPVSGPTPLTAASIAALELQKAQLEALLL